mmetsp:Transcript_12091/g.24949  ORF Transcript_12091/g.24949 Transcript_12091/m.24949 type:complete len:207 (-) Transcript_12091:62-682(-)
MSEPNPRILAECRAPGHQRQERGRLFPGRPLYSQPHWSLCGRGGGGGRGRRPWIHRSRKALAQGPGGRSRPRRGFLSGNWLFCRRGDASRQAPEERVSGTQGQPIGLDGWCDRKHGRVHWQKQGHSWFRGRCRGGSLGGNSDCRARRRGDWRGGGRYDHRDGHSADRSTHQNDTAKTRRHQTETRAACPVSVLIRSSSSSNNNNRA